MLKFKFFLFQSFEKSLLFSINFNVKVKFAQIYSNDWMLQIYLRRRQNIKL